MTNCFSVNFNECSCLPFLSVPGEGSTLSSFVWLTTMAVNVATALQDLSCPCTGNVCRLPPCGDLKGPGLLHTGNSEKNNKTTIIKMQLRWLIFHCHNLLFFDSLLQSNPQPTKQEIEDNFDGNICRCTGVRS